jgi:DeoR family transcriptional regulator, fructose operon transcriptional repressor
LFLAERLDKIKEIVRDRKNVDVVTLSKILGVTKVTTRSDLEILEEEGFLKKIHGGVVLTDELNEIKLEKKIDISRYKEKSEIINLSLKLINDDDTLFIGPGTTCTLLAKKLQGKPNLRVITNNLEVIDELYPGIQNIMLLGGVINSKNNTLFTYSSSVDDFFSGIFFNKALITVDGIDTKAGFTADNMNLVSIIKKVRKISNTLIILADYLKFDKIGLYQIGELDFADYLITNGKLNDNYKELFFRKNIKILTSYDI